MKNFSGLYKEGLRQTRVFGLTALLMSAASSAYMLLDKASEYAVSEAAALLTWLLGMALLPVCLMRLFGFVSSRSASDFYHSIPAKRETIYISFALAALSWTALASMPLLLLVLAAGKGFLRILFALAGLWSIVCGAVSLASSVSGGVIGRLCASGAILFVPRIIISIINERIAEWTVVYVPGSLAQLSTNPVFAALVSFDSTEPLGTSAVMLAYGLIVGAAYFLIGLLCFKKRASEAAGSSAINKWVQLITRVCIALVPCLLVIAIGSFDFFAVLVWFIAIVLFFVYDFITSGSGARQSIKLSLLGIGILVLVNLAILLAIFTGGRSVLSFRPTADDIKSVSVSESTDDYNSLLAGKVKISDRTAAEILTKALSDELDRRDNYVDSDFWKSLTVTYRTGLRTETRQINVTKSSYERLVNALIENEEYAAAAFDMPAPEEITRITVSHSLNYVYSNDMQGYELDAKAVYEALYSEVGAMTAKEKLASGAFELNQQHDYNGYFEEEFSYTTRPCDFVICSFWVETKDSLKNACYTVTMKTPETAAFCLSQNTEGRQLDDVLEVNDQVTVYVTEVTPGSTPDSRISVRCFSLFGGEVESYLAELKENAGAFDLSKPFVVVEADAWEDEYNWFRGKQVFFSK